MKISKKDLVKKYVISKIGNYIQDLNYTFQGETIGNSEEKMGDINFLFRNIFINREIVVSYLPFDVRGDVNECMCIFIHRLPDDSYTLQNIFKHEGIQYNENKFCLLNYSGSFEDQLEQFCCYIIGLFENHLKIWISGEKWEDIPFDWGRYK